ncbi:hypothetical protein [Phormidium pseudopriestleyi]|nr:hypothetical protein [Phormidium pseudopriestleyi]
MSRGIGGWRVLRTWLCYVTKKEVGTRLHTGAIADCECVTQAIATSGGPHFNPPLAKGREPEVLLCVKNLLL